MLVENNQWTPESAGSVRIHSPEELEGFVEEMGFVPYFKSRIPGFSVEEYCPVHSWWSGDPANDPWEWRAAVAGNGRVAFARLFENKMGFVSRKWYPILAAYRRSGYDFDSRWDEGLASRRDKLVMDQLEGEVSIPSDQLRQLAGFGGDGEKGFDSAVNRLMMQTYITVRGFRRKVSARGEEYGWAVSVFSTPEALFGRELVTSAYSIEPDEAFERLVNHVRGLFPNADEKAVRKLLK